MNIALRNAYRGLVDMPLCEAISSTGTGAALSGMRPMVEIQFGGLQLGFNALHKQLCSDGDGVQTAHDNKNPTGSKNTFRPIPC